MDFQVSFKVNENIFLRNPEQSELGRQIIKHAIDLIYNVGFEHFTFKKLAIDMQTTEASVYRYFENKHRLLLYILNWYWSYMEFLVMFKLQNIQDNKIKLKTIIELLTNELPDRAGQLEYNKTYLHHIVITESSKVYLVKEVKAINEHEVFKPYKDLCSKIAEIIVAYNPAYKYPRSLSSTLIETSHDQQFFCQYLPKLTDIHQQPSNQFTAAYLEELLFKILD
ncbi:MAG: TetR/AcrR family transcriptional regulator [Chitinophagaceae bacterium]|nr:TetR/AcrR family transcriptional regulator [Chitinophagaceae bacterium]